MSAASNPVMGTMADPATHAVADAASARDRRDDVWVERDIVFGSARVGHSDPATATSRELRLDAYLPRDAVGSRPALVLAFGGAFHRGSRVDDVVTEGATPNTSIANYCRAFARRGHACFSIDYRLVQEDPDPGTTTVVHDPDGLPRSRVDVVREKLGLPPASNRQLWCGIEAAADDVASAFRFVAAQAGRWNIDPRRIAVGGFSAGARSAWNAAYGEGIDAAAVVALSGAMGTHDLAYWLAAGRALPPLLLIRGEHDLDYVRASNPPSLALCRAAGIACVEAVVPGAGHFYPSSAAVDCSDFAGTVDDVIAGFLARVFR